MKTFNAKNLKEFTVREAEKLAKEKGYERVIVIYLNEDKNGITYEYGVTTYGKTKELCNKTAKIGEELAKGIDYFMHKEKNKEE